ncbi:MAG: FG-GAP-like repeat-containing protein [candidate division KSB1 bacterium]|nr:FG-GAP-like repeat-containing protein [candidate division KSB1 bacterium]
MVINTIPGSRPHIIHTADLDNDGDQDVIVGSFGDDNIVWYENDGTGNFNSQPLLIDEDADDVQSIYVVDLDADGDLDVLSATYANNRITWYENTGAGFFSEPKMITNEASGANSVYAADMDQDGDLDVVSASIKDTKIAWYENTGDTEFGSQQVLAELDGLSSMFAADMDQDGDPDIVTISKETGNIAWHENVGIQDDELELADEPNIIYTLVPAGNCNITKVDLDVDGDPDVLASIEDADKVEWYENSGSGTFRTRAVTDSTVGVKSAFASDFDKDGDLDIVTVSYSDAYRDDKIAWFENTGNRSFSNQKIIGGYLKIRGPMAVAAADFDGDGFPDIVAASTGRDEIVWFENLLEDTGVDELTEKPNHFGLTQNYPNPFNPSTVIEYALPKTSQVTVSIYNSLGQSIKTLVNTEQTAGHHSVRWNGLDENGQTVSNGVYYYRISADQFSETKKMLLVR